MNDDTGFSLISQSQVVQAVFLLHILSTAFMAGVIWFVQVVHYPLFLRTGIVEFADYHRKHARLTGFVVGPPMFFEATTAAALVFLAPGILSAWPFTVALLLLALIWL